MGITRSKVKSKTNGDGMTRKADDLDKDFRRAVEHDDLLRRPGSEGAP